MSEPIAEKDVIDQFIIDATNRGIIPMHVAADLSQYLGEWVDTRDAPPLIVRNIRGSEGAPLATFHADERQADAFEAGWIQRGAIEKGEVS